MEFKEIIIYIFNFGVPTALLAGGLFVINKHAPNFISAINGLRDVIKDSIQSSKISLEKVKENFTLSHEDHNQIKELLIQVKQEFIEYKMIINQLKESITTSK